jgi:hypothetical protein
MTERLTYDDATLVIEKKYGGRSSNIISTLSQKACISLAECCNNGNTPDLSQSTLTKLSNMDEDDQARWIANPYAQSLITAFMAQLLQGSSSSQSNTTPKPDVKPNNKPAPKPEPKPAEPEDDEPLFDLFD